jgi:uncharacterized RDD family membrane protein YckC
VQSGRQATGDGRALHDSRASPHRRVSAALIDFAIAGVCGVFVADLVFPAWMDELSTEWQTNDLMGAWIGATALFVMMPYYAISEILCGRTIGKALLGLKVVSLSGGMSRWRMLVRNLIRIVWTVPYLGYGLLLFADFVLVCATPKNQRLGDLIAGTTVVRARVRFV